MQEVYRPSLHCLDSSSPVQDMAMISIKDSWSNWETSGI